MSSSKWKYRTYYVNIDSSDRDRKTWPNSGNFEVKFQPDSTFSGATVNRAFKNVVTVEVMDVMFPNIPKASKNMYYYLCFPELTDGVGVFESTNNYNTKALVKILPLNVVGHYVISQYQQPETTRIVFPVEGKRIDKLTVEFRTNTGAIFDFSENTDNGSTPNPLLQTSITLRITVRDKVIP